MFEFIGMAFVAWVLWRIYKYFSVMRAMNRTLTTAETLGVSRQESLRILNDPLRLEDERLRLVAANPHFSGLPLPEQFAYAIRFIHNEEQDPGEAPQAKGLVEPSLQEALHKLIWPQLQAVMGEDRVVQVNHVVFAYVSALAAAVSGKALAVGTPLTSMMWSLFKGLGSDHLVANAAEVVQFMDSSDFLDLELKLAQLAQQEVEVGKGEYLIKYTRKLERDIEAMFDPSKGRVDPSKEPEDDILAV